MSATVVIPSMIPDPRHLSPSHRPTTWPVATAPTVSGNLTWTLLSALHRSLGSTHRLPCLWTVACTGAMRWRTCASTFMPSEKSGIPAIQLNSELQSSTHCSTG